jgi:hypothetical protein
MWYNRIKHDFTKIRILHGGILMTEQPASRNSTSTVAWALGLAACLCNLIIVLLPIGLILGVVALILGAAGAKRSSGTGRSTGLVLSAVSFVIAAIWIGTIVSVFLIDPTLL